jgi:TetR/AcrR family transcriptional regulator
VPVDKETRTRNAEQTREAILQAALAEFSRENVAAARTDEIARSAGVNKALLYYYFKDKDSLYEAVLDHAFNSIYPRLEAILDSDLSFQEKILSYYGTHFDALAQNPQFCRVIHHELTRFGHHSDFSFKKLTNQHHVQLAVKLQQVLRAGIDAGEFRSIDTINFAVSMVATNVFYFGPFYARETRSPASCGS